MKGEFSLLMETLQRLRIGEQTREESERDSAFVRDYAKRMEWMKWKC